MVGNHHNQTFDSSDQNQNNFSETKQQQQRLLGISGLEIEMPSGGMTGVLNHAYSSSSLDIQQDQSSEHHFQNFHQSMPINELGELRNSNSIISKHQQLSVNINRDTNLLNTTNAATATTLQNLSNLPVLKSGHSTLQQHQQHSVHLQSTKIKIDPSCFVNLDSGANESAHGPNNNSTNTLTQTTSSQPSATPKFFNYQSNTKLNLD